MKKITKNTITSILGFIFILAGVLAAFIVQVNTIILIITLVTIGLGLVWYRSALWDWLINKIK